MKNKKGNVAVIAIIIVIVSITASVITWLVATKIQAPAQKEVVAQSAPIAQTQPKPAAPAPAAQPTAPTQANIVVPSDWKMYRDQAYGFQFSYPKSWGSMDVNNSDPSSAYSVSVFNGQDNVQIIKVAYGVDGDGSVQNRESYLKDFASGKYEKIDIAGGSGYYFVEETMGGSSPSAYLVGDKEIFLMGYSIFDVKKTPKLEAEKLLKQIIGTFKFTN